MAITRGLNREDRLALDIVTVTADASLVLSPCFVYGIWVQVIDTNSTGSVVLADTTASGSEVDKETTKLEVKVGGSAASAVGDSTQYYPLPKPWHVRNTLAADITNATCTVMYLPVG